MKIQVASDLHLEFIDRRYPGFIGITPAREAEVLVLAGNIHNRSRGMEMFAAWPVPVIYVPGNHEYYGTDFRTQRDVFTYADAHAFPSVIALERRIFEYKGIRFAGTTLWTDFNLYGQCKRSRRAAACKIRDYRTIRLRHRSFGTRDSVREHAKSVEWLDRVLSEPFHGATVVVTNHAPLSLSLERTFDGHPLNPSYASDLLHLLGRCSLWVHGHVHASCDYSVSGTRIVANPRGYPDIFSDLRRADLPQWENRNFRRNLVIDVSPVRRQQLSVGIEFTRFYPSG